MNKIVGFIGCGNMGSAMMKGMVSSGIITSDQLWVADAFAESFEKIKDLHAHTTLDNKEVVKHADILILSVKPYMYEPVISNIKDCFKENVIVVAIAAGKTMAQLKYMCGVDTKIVRVMPNTPAMVQEGMSALVKDNLVTEEEMNEIVSIFNSFGKAEIIKEDLMDAVVAVSGSSPAYVYMFIEAMADAAVAQGMPRAQAYKFAAQAVLGSAKMVLETGMHPGALKDNVCSPGGTTIDAVMELEKTGFRASVMQAMKVCAEKSKEMSK
ncbi:MAG: pyrroline-5-carboxylate reductase [Holdemanella sp.]|nr:pyrroline-5-carboxylate reductase [Holdemanella sp.]